MPKPAISPEMRSLETHPALAEVASKLFFWAAAESDSAIFLRQALPLMAQALGGEYLALVQGIKGQWRTLGASGPERPLPHELLSEALDRDQAVVRAEWYVAPLESRTSSGELLAAYRTWNTTVE